MNNCNPWSECFTNEFTLLPWRGLNNALNSGSRANFIANTAYSSGVVGQLNVEENTRGNCNDSTIPITWLFVHSCNLGADTTGTPAANDSRIGKFIPTGNESNTAITWDLNTWNELSSIGGRNLKRLIWIQVMSWVGKQN